MEKQIAVHNHPPQRTSFVGRQQELSDITNHYFNANCRLLTLLGPGGIGKTRLAIHAADRCAAKFNDGAYFVPCQPLTSSELIVSAIANALDFQFSPVGEPKQQLLEHLQKRSLLLILDNLEHLLDNIEIIAEIVVHASRVCILATSRERLNLSEEWIYDVPELAFPMHDTSPDSASFDAVRLFLERVQQTRHTFVMSETDLATISRICGMAGGLPLGIELAASWSNALSLQDIACELECGLDILQTSTRNVKPRHQSIRLTFEPMWKSLSDDERKLFSQLSQFRGGFTLAAAAYVADAKPLVLSRLVNSSLLRMDGEGCYDIHELLRHYAHEQLSADAKHLKTTRDRHCQYYMSFLDQQRAKLESYEQALGFAEIQREIDNVRVAWQWAVEHGYAEDLACGSHVLWYYLDIRSEFQEGERLFRRALEAIDVEGDATSVPKAVGKLLAYYGGFCYSLNLPKQARSSLEKSLAILRSCDAPAELGYTLLRLSEVAMYAENNPELGKAYLLESLAIFRALTNQWGIAFSLRWLGNAALQLGDYDEGHRYIQESLVIYRTIGESFGTTMAYLVAIRLGLAQKDFAYAERIGDEILRLSMEIGIRWNIPHAYILQGASACGLKQYSKARQKLYDGLKGAVDINFTPFILSGLMRIAYLLDAVGQQVRALEVTAFLLKYPISPIAGKLPLEELYALLEGKLPPNTFTAAVSRGRKLFLQVVIDDCLNLFSSDGSLFQDKLSLIETLTSRELEVLQLVADGLSNAEIAETLVVAISTVKKHTNNIYNKLHVKSRTRAIIRARELNLIH